MSLTTYKKPKTEDNHIGIEIEFVSSLSRSEVTKILNKSTLKNFMRIRDDSSIRTSSIAQGACPRCNIFVSGSVCRNCGAFRGVGPVRADSYGHELNILLTEKDLYKSLLVLGKDLKSIKAKVNDSCGLHVHIDMRNRSPYKVFNVLLKNQDFLFRLCKKERRNNDYCHKVSKSANVFKDGDHYDAINTNALGEHNTIELRMHHGSVKITEIYNWIRTILAIVDGVKTPANLKNWQKSQTKAMAA